MNDLQKIFLELPSLQVVAVTTNKSNVIESLRRDKNVFYNYMVNGLLTDLLPKYPDIELVLDDRTIRRGSRNSPEDCLKAKCWGELGLDAHISCRYENSAKNPGIWLADWLSNFVWRHYENLMHEPYHACQSPGNRYYEKTLFM